MLQLSPHYSNRPQDLVVQAGLIAGPPIMTAGNDGLPPQPSAVAVTVGVIVAIEERAAGEEEAVVEVVMVMVIPIPIPLPVPVVAGYAAMAHRRTIEVAASGDVSRAAAAPGSATEVIAAHAVHMASADAGEMAARATAAAHHMAAAPTAAHMATTAAKGAAAAPRAAAALHELDHAGGALRERHALAGRMPASARCSGRENPPSSPLQIHDKVIMEAANRWRPVAPR